MMVDIQIRDDFDVELIQVAGDDEFICKAARVSTMGAASIDSEESAGLLNFLMSNRHGSPFEHGFFTFRITAPIFVWREFMRHRIGYSYNEESGRYKELDGVFYIPPAGRNLVQVGKPGAYTLVPGTESDYKEMYNALSSTYFVAWANYKSQLEKGIAKEVARMCLPVAIYSSAYVTCNPRSMMSFLSLRTDVPSSAYPSKPQWEINQVANDMEKYFMAHFPITHEVFCKNGRVSP